MDDEERNYCCLVLLLSRVGSPCLRIYFKNQWNALGRYKPWTDCARNGADLRRMFKPLPYEEASVKSGNTSQWDLPLLVKALLFSRPPFVVAAHLVAALETLKEIRNQLCHSPVSRVKSADFQKSWNDGCTALSLFGATAVDFDKVEEDVKKPWSELLPMVKHCADQAQDILYGLNLINGKLGQLQETIVESHARLQENVMEKQARLQETVVESHARLQENVMEKQDRLQGNVVESHARLQENVMEKQDRLQGNVVESHARLQENVMEKQARLQETVVESHARLQENVMEKQARLQGTVVESHARLQEIILEGQATTKEAISNQHSKLLEEITLNVQKTSDRPTEKDLSSRVQGLVNLDLPSKNQEYSEKIRRSIKNQTDFLLTSEDEGKKIRTDDIFTNVTIVRGKKQFKEPKVYGRRRIENLQMRFGWRGTDEVEDEDDQKSSTTLKTCSEMFLCPGNDDQKSSASVTTNPKSILLTGKAGIGKSLFCQKLVRDWAENTLFKDCEEDVNSPDFQFVVLLTFRQLSNPRKDKEYQKEELINLRDLLNRSPILDEHSMIDESLLQYMIEHPEKLLIIIDGYDEYTEQEKITGDFEMKYPNDPREKIPVPALVTKILKGKMLKESVVLISSRPGRAEELKKIAFDVRCEIEGFASIQVLEYIEKYFKDREGLKERVLHHIKTNEILLSFANIPVMCFLMCYCIEWYMTKSKTTEKLPVTRTELYDQVIRLFLKKHSFSKYEEMEESKLRELKHKLAELAMTLTIQGKYIFDENYLKQFKFNDEEITNLKASGLLDCCAGLRKAPSEKPPLEFTFTHLTIQEFFTSWWLVEKNQIPEKEKTSDVTFMLMAGLCSLRRDEKLMKKLIEKIKPKNPYDYSSKLLPLSCLYEYKDSVFSTRVIQKQKRKYCDHNGWITINGVTDIDCLYISFLLETVNSINAEQTRQHSIFRSSIVVNALSIGRSFLSASGIRMLCNSLFHIPSVTEFVLYDCKLDDECVRIISDVLSRTSIVRLNLSSNNITDIGVQFLGSVLERGCRVKRLVLWGNGRITTECIEVLRKQIPSVMLQI